MTADDFDKHLSESKPPLKAFPQLDLDCGLASYYISSSHNTYLSGDQLYGQSTFHTYERVLSRNARCVEIDAWDGENGEPHVYHGWTLTKPVAIREVIAAIGNGITESNPFPIIISLECHCSAPQQDVMARIFKEILGDKLVQDEIEGVDPKDLRLKHVLGKVLVQIEHHASIKSDQMREPPSESNLSDSEDEGDTRSGADEEERELKKKKKRAKESITPSLAALGVYTQSVKPPEGTWWQDHILAPLQRVVNISEGALSALLPISATHVLEHTASHLMRVYPAGMRITSLNMDPLPYWRNGSQVCALNWQRFDLGMELNTALFDSTQGWLLKPQHLRGSQEARKDPGTGLTKLELIFFGARDLPDAGDVGPKTKMEPYAKIDIVSSQGKKRHRTKVAKPAHGDLGRNPIWNERATFEWKDESLVFLRIRIIHDDGFMHKDDPIASYAALISRLEQGWLAIPLLSNLGDPLEARLLMHVKLE